ncbi:hypothetical protein D3C78_1457620 [compost metagenome]
MQLLVHLLERSVFIDEAAPDFGHQPVGVLAVPVDGTLTNGARRDLAQCGLLIGIQVGVSIGDVRPAGAGQRVEVIVRVYRCFSSGSIASCCLAHSEEVFISRRSESISDFVRR